MSNPNAILTPIGRRAYQDVIKGAPRVPKPPVVQVEIMYGNLDDATMRKWINAVSKILSSFPEEVMTVVKQNQQLQDLGDTPLMLRFQDGRTFKGQRALEVLKNALKIDGQVRDEDDFVLQSRKESTIPFQGSQIKPDQFHMKTIAAPFASIDKTAPRYGAVPREPQFLPPHPIHNAARRPLQRHLPHPGSGSHGYIYPRSRFGAHNTGGGQYTSYQR